MDVKLPNGKIIRGVPEGTPKEEIARKAIAAGLATEQDFGFAAPQPKQNNMIPVGTGAQATYADLTQQPMQQPFSELASEQSGFDTALIAAGKGFADLLRGVGLMDEADETEIKAYEALKKSKPITSAIGEVVGQAAPFAAAGGPIIAGIAGTGGRMAASTGLGALEGGIIAKGTGQNVTEGALTGAAFGAGGQAIGEGIDAVRRIATGSPQANAAVDYAKSRGLPLMTTDVVEPKTAVGRGVRNIAEQVPFIGTSGERAAQQAARVSEIENLKSLYPEVTDQQIYKAFTDSGEKYRKVMADRYNNISTAMGTREIPAQKTFDVIDSELAELTKGGGIKDSDTISKLQKIRDDLASGAQTFQGLRDNRTFLREQLKSDTSNTQADRVIDRVYDAMTSDITDAVSKNLGEDTARKLKQVDSLFRAEKEIQKKTKIKNILAKGEVLPEEATKAIFSSRPSDVREAYAALDKNGRAIARAAIVNRFIQAAGENTSPEKFVAAMNKFDNQFGTFFKGTERKQLEGLKAYLNATRRAGQVQADPVTGNRLIPWLSVGGVADITQTGGVATGLTASIAAMSKAYESPPVKKAMLILARTPKGSAEYQKAVNAVNSAMIAAQQQEQQE